jgi:hypothetical protein
MNHERFTRTKTWPATVLLMALACGPEVAEHADLPVECPYPEDRVAIRWYQVDDIEEREKLRRWCAAVGSPVIDVPDRPAPRAPIDSLAVVSWNTHVGGRKANRFLTSSSCYRRRFAPVRKCRTIRRRERVTRRRSSLPGNWVNAETYRL